MSLKAKVLIQPIPNNKFTNATDVLFPKKFHAWKLHNQMVTISFGHRKFDVHCKIHEENEDSIFISHSFAKELLLPQLPMTLSISYQRDKAHISIGPVFAVLTAFNKKRTPYSFGAIDKFCIELSSFCNKHGLFFYVFSLDDFNGDEVAGFTYSNQMWQKHHLPIPNVIYNRIHSRKIEKSQRAQQFFEMCKELEIPYFNDRFLNKWEVHDLLSSELHLKVHLPETSLFSRKSHFLSMVKNFDSIYVKPIYGSQGKHIYRITKEVDQYVLEHSGIPSKNHLTFNDENELYLTLKRKVAKRPFLIQQGISLHEHKNRTVDFRVLCNRDYYGEWFVSSMMARLSPPKNFVSNVAQGGELLKPEDVLNRYSKSDKIQIIKALNELALEFCLQIEKNFEGDYGELGVDLALDQEGSIWFIEVNVKPSKDMDGNISSLKVRPSAKAILQYGSYLANH